MSRDPIHNIQQFLVERRRLLMRKSSWNIWKYWLGRAVVSISPRSIWMEALRVTGNAPRAICGGRIADVCDLKDGSVAPKSIFPTNRVCYAADKAALLLGFILSRKKSRHIS